MIGLGSRVKCKYTGFTGIAIARSVYLNGCTRVCVQPEGVKDGKVIESEWFDEIQLETEKVAVFPAFLQTPAGAKRAVVGTGGPAREGTRSSRDPR